MNIGYLHIGLPQHGIHRYGRLLAAEARTRSQINVIEADVQLTGDRSCDRHALINAAQTLSQADVIHFQYNRVIWGEDWRQIHHLNTFLDRCSRPLIVTLHDIFYPPSSATLVHKYRSHPGSVRVAELIKAILRDQLSPNILALQKVISRSQSAFVCTQEEARRLSDRIVSSKIKIIPHFVESRTPGISRIESRKVLHLDNFTVITLLGFIYSGKGHKLLIQALPHLPAHVKLIFAGGVSPGHEAYFQDLMALAEKEGVRDRIHVTGYLSELELERYLLATDLAVCPFRQTSASSSLSTWLSVACPILASSIPQIAEYNALAPGAIKIFEDYTPNGLKAAILEFLATGCKPEDHKIAALRHQLSISNIFDQHLHYYNRLLEFDYVA
ncbi:group 1 glycosyl transferase [Leptolyngbya boryana NIES-2135]|jgi:glycosyltransferase involved in cell wall biosynthesis|uniref:Group 1 glycosyl transferase n=1 Tax=Leptolyngbya boryana NIES-2135 TaxID=1973484 RepID=A0A1Z4JBH4_LEPBY|nr:MULTISPECIES: glycosyltransferase [Leptolyngbya]BAY54081.1 group 1 glycosyl transferase [Leptolyngbya boryana NIES-2135]MBD2369738.1 glycosyltransferase [Leptolyngbya sp. FACHB-161]MBD2376061.1 glycosyltransferase [Leptolyngbya sp. FACHB-238]MBD2400337.1 glycosyltransferase [Leptolyngbya sp. FACHB-239]MBD2406878.1 glycosyltransferase [Leptolyngbya sp. FACHB-402]